MLGVWTFGRQTIWVTDVGLTVLLFIYYSIVHEVETNRKNTYITHKKLKTKGVGLS